ncbi:BTAD domain-containing putative transcriptional regulator [Streptomyces puniciscabiei]
MFRLHEATKNRLLDIHHTSIGLAPEVEVDYHHALRLLEDMGRRLRMLPCPPPTGWQVLRQRLLADIDVACVEPKRVEWDLQRGRTLEAMAEALLQQGMYLAATEVADAAAEVHEFREAPRRIAIDACLREGEIAEAHMRFRCYESLLQRELGVSPSPVIPSMLKAWEPAARRAGAR